MPRYTLSSPHRPLLLFGAMLERQQTPSTAISISTPLLSINKNDLISLRLADRLMMVAKDPIILVLACLQERRFLSSMTGTSDSEMEVMPAELPTLRSRRIPPSPLISLPPVLLAISSSEIFRTRTPFGKTSLLSTSRSERQP